MAHSPDCHVVLLGQAGSPMLVYSVLLPPHLVMFDLCLIPLLSFMYLSPVVSSACCHVVPCYCV